MNLCSIKIVPCLIEPYLKASCNMLKNNFAAISSSKFILECIELPPRLHGHPVVWWVAQFVKYVMRPQPEAKRILDSLAESNNMAKGPMVGMQERKLFC